MTHSPELNKFMPDSHPATNYTNYLRDIAVEMKKKNVQNKENLTYQRDYEFDDFLRVQNVLKVDIIQRKSLYKISDFYSDGELKHSDYENDKFLDFLRNSVNMQETPFTIYVFVVEN